MKKFYKIFLLLTALIFLTTYDPSEINFFSHKSASFFNIKKIKILNSQAISEKEIGLNYGFADSDSKLDDATQMMRLALPRILRAAEYENSILELARSLEKTQRLLNALDYVIMPGYDESIKYISSILEEREREDFSRLKHVKKVLERKR